MKSKACCAILTGLLCLCAAQAATAAGDKPRTVLRSEPINAPDAEQSFKNLDAKTQRLKQDMLLLNRDLILLEEDVFFPAASRVTIYMALSVDPRFTLETVSLKINDEVVGNYDYDDAQNDALKAGGAHRLELLNLRPGQHSLSAGLTGYFTDRKGEKRRYQRTTSMTVEKRPDDQTWIVLQLDGPSGDLQPRFAAREWRPES